MPFSIHHFPASLLPSFTYSLPPSFYLLLLPLRLSPCYTFPPGIRCDFFLLSNSFLFFLLIPSRPFLIHYIFLYVLPILSFPISQSPSSSSFPIFSSLPLTFSSSIYFYLPPYLSISPHSLSSKNKMQLILLHFIHNHSLSITHFLLIPSLFLSLPQFLLPSPFLFYFFPSFITHT